MSTRRSFLQGFAAGASLGVALRDDALERVLAAGAGAAGRAAEEVARDEDYWREIQQAFTLDRTLINLNNALPKLGVFDVIFLRNVMIYFDIDTKRKVIQRILPLLHPGGYFMISHSENLNGITDALKTVRPSIYRKPDA